ncbi:MAG: leucine-rich repeat domain-containing protein [Ruminococcus sp.]|nr:leucine-rich repeat domain-containing protein [Ruminococcus sp.]
MDALLTDSETVVNCDAIEADSAKYFVETKDDDGCITERGTFYVTDGTIRSEGTVERTANASQVKAVEDVKEITVNGSDTIKAVKGEKTYVEMLLDGKTLAERAGVRAILESSDQDVFTVRDNSIESYKTGDAKLNITILPANSEKTAEFNGTEEDAVKLASEVDNYADVPSSLIKTFEAKVKVSDSSDEPADEPSDDKPADTEKVKTAVKNGVTYKISGKSAVVSKSDKKAKTITIPATVTISGKSYKVTKINKNVFKNSKKLTSVKIGKNVTSIGDYAFKGCKKLTKVTLGKKVKTIGKGAFMNCVKLKKLTIPKSVKKIGAKAFYGCKALKKVTFKPTKAPTIGKNAFGKINKKAKFSVPKKSKKKYVKKLVKKVGVTKTMTIK